MKLVGLLAAIYLALVVAIVVVLLKVRSNTLTEMNTPAARDNWNQWREAAAKETGETTPVRRSAPTTAEPPLLVLMRDHFAAAVFGLLAPTTALYVFAAWIVTGVIKQSRAADSASRSH